MLYQGFVATPSMNVLDKKNFMKTLARAIEICMIFLPIMLLPGIVIPIVRYSRGGHVLFLVGGIITSLIFPITLLFLTKDYDKVKAWRSDENFEYEKCQEEVDRTVNKIKWLHLFKAFLSWVSLILFIVGMIIELNQFIDSGDIKFKA